MLHVTRAAPAGLGENPDFRAGLGARWTFLSDAERRHTDALGLRETTDTTNDPYLPTVVLLHPDPTVAERFDGYWYRGRPGREELRAACARSPGRSAPTSTRRALSAVAWTAQCDAVPPDAELSAALDDGGGFGGYLVAWRQDPRPEGVDARRIDRHGSAHPWPWDRFPGLG